MTAPQRLIEADDQFERELIRSAHDDRPSQRALERMLLGLGVDLPQLPSAAAGSATSGKLGGSVLAKWLFSGLAIGLSAIGGAEVVGRALDQRGGQAAETAKPVVAALPSPAASVPGIASSSPPEGELSTAQNSPSAFVPGARLRLAAGPLLGAAGAPNPLASSPSASPPSASPPIASAASSGRPGVGSFVPEAEPALPATLAAEMRLLEAARRALASGAPRSALAALASYERAFQNGALGPEASLLKVRALLAAGDRAGAEALGRQVIAREPHSEHAGAVRAALGPRSNP